MNTANTETPNKVWLDGNVWRWETKEAFGTGDSMTDATNKLTASLDTVSPVMFEENGIVFIA